MPGGKLLRCCKQEPLGKRLHYKVKNRMSGEIILAQRSEGQEADTHATRCGKSVLLMFFRPCKGKELDITEKQKRG